MNQRLSEKTGKALISFYLRSIFNFFLDLMALLQRIMSAALLI